MSRTFSHVDAPLERLRRFTTGWFAVHERRLLFALLLVEVVLRILLVAHSSGSISGNRELSQASHTVE